MRATRPPPSEGRGDDTGRSCGGGGSVEVDVDGRNSNRDKEGARTTRTTGRGEDREGSSGGGWNREVDSGRNDRDNAGPFEGAGGAAPAPRR